MTSPAALRQDRQPIDRGTRNGHAGNEYVSRHDLRMTNNPPPEPGDKTIGGVVVRMVNGGLKLAARRRAGEA